MSNVEQIYETLASHGIVDEKIEQTRQRLQRHIAAQSDGFKALTPPEDIAVFETPLCEEDCEACGQQWRSVKLQKYNDCLAYSGVVSDWTASNVTKALSGEILEGFNTLKDVLRQYGDVVLKAWTQMSKSERRLFIQQAVPDIYEDRFPDIDTYYAKGDWLSKRKSKPWSLLLPRFTLSTLTETDLVLLTMLDARSRCEPSSFLLQDLYSVNRVLMTYLPHWFNGHAIKTGGQDAYHLEEQDFTKAHIRESYAWPEAIHILRAQAVLYHNLSTIARNLVGDSESISGCRNWVKACEEDFLSFSSTKMHSKSKTAQHGPPLQLNFDEIVDLAKQRSREAQEELEALQTSPKHLQRVISSMRDTKYYSTLPEEKMWLRLVLDIWVPHFRRLRAWEALTVRAMQAREACKQSDFTPNSEIPITDAANWSLALLDYAKNKVIDIDIVPMMKQDLPKLGRFEKHFTYNKTQHAKPVSSLAGRLSGAVPWTLQDKDRDPLFWALAHMTYRAPSMRWVDCRTAMEVITNELESNESKLAALKGNSQLSQHISDLGVLVWIEIGLDQCRPHHDLLQSHEDAEAAMDMLHGIGMLHEGEAKMPDPYGYWNEGFPTLDDLSFPDGKLVKAVVLLKAFCNDSPWPQDTKARDLSWLEQTSLARRNLISFWQEMREVRFQALRGLHGDLRTDKQLARTRAVATLTHFSNPEVLQKVEAEAASIREKAFWDREQSIAREAAKLASAKTEMEAIELAKLPTSNDPRSPKKLKSPVARKAKKTRKRKEKKRAKGGEGQETEPDDGQANDEDAVAELEAPNTVGLMAHLNRITVDLPSPVAPPTPQTPKSPRSRQKIPVSKDSLATFARLWPIESGEHGGGKVDWDDFTKAMVDAGFSIWAADGSAFNFRKKDLGSITFHKPHPSTELPSKFLKRNGKRLTNWFGYTYASFRVNRAMDL